MFRYVLGITLQIVRNIINQWSYIFHGPIGMYNIILQLLVCNRWFLAHLKWMLYALSIVCEPICDYHRVWRDYLGDRACDLGANLVQLFLKFSLLCLKFAIDLLRNQFSNFLLFLWSDPDLPIGLNSIKGYSFIPNDITLPNKIKAFNMTCTLDFFPYSCQCRILNNRKCMFLILIN